MLWRKLKGYLHRYIPSHIADPFGLARRMLFSKNPSARFALYTATWGIVLLPFDLLLQFVERRYYKNARQMQLPILFICGPARSGTTLVYQVLVQSLPVAYINNMTALFPRSPVAASKLLGKYIHKNRLSFNSYYSKTSGLAGVNDGNHIWNRWTGLDRIDVRTILLPSKIDDMRRFFQAFEKSSNKPIVNKFNNLNAFANKVASIFPNAYFICMTRAPAFLAQSLLITRKEIQGDISIGYGVTNPDKTKDSKDYVLDICEQVVFLEHKALEQKNAIGEKRFWIVSYEEFCLDPNRLINRVAQEILNLPKKELHSLPRVEPFKDNNSLRIDEKLFHKIENTLSELEKQRCARVE